MPRYWSCLRCGRDMEYNTYECQHCKDYTFQIGDRVYIEWQGGYYTAKLLEPIERDGAIGWKVYCPDFPEQWMVDPSRDTGIQQELLIKDTDISRLISVIGGKLVIDWQKRMGNDA